MTIREAWLAAMKEAHSLARAERLGELRGDYIKRFNGQGVHPFSQAIGAAVALADLDPDECGIVDPVGIREKAREDAMAEFVNELQQNLFAQAPEKVAA